MTICSHMICPYCKGNTRIYNSRSTHQKTQTWRRHRCTVCSQTFTTRERMDWDGVVMVQSNDECTPYNKEHLLLSLINATQNLKLAPGTAFNLCDTIELQLQIKGFFKTKHQSAKIITEVAISVLQRFDPNLAIQYINNIYNNQPPVELLREIVNNQ